MTALLWARPVFGAILLGLVGLYVWTARAADATNGPGNQPRTKPTRQYQHQE